MTEQSGLTMAAAMLASMRDSWCAMRDMLDDPPMSRPRLPYGYETCPFCGQSQHVPTLGSVCRHCGGDVLNRYVL